MPATPADIIVKAPVSSTTGEPSLLNRPTAYTMRPTHPSPVVEIVKPVVVVTPEPPEAPRVPDVERTLTHEETLTPREETFTTDVETKTGVAEGRARSLEYLKHAEEASKGFTEIAKQEAKASLWKSLANALRSKPAVWGFGIGIGMLAVGIAFWAASTVLDKTLESMGFAKEDRTLIYWCIAGLIGIVVFYFVVSKISPYIKAGVQK